MSLDSLWSEHSFVTRLFCAARRLHAKFFSRCALQISALLISASGGFSAQIFDVQTVPKKMAQIRSSY